MKRKHIIALDLELNKQGEQTTDIIEIGIAVGDIETRQVISSISILVKPSEPLDPFIIKLTGITQKMIDEEALPISEAYSKLCEYLKDFDYYKAPVVWGGEDSNELKKQIQNNFPINSWVFGYTSLNIKTITQAIRMSKGKELQGGLAKSMTKVYGISFKGKKHRAVDDAKNTLMTFFHILNKLQTLEFK